MRQIKAAGEGLGADEDVDFSRFDSTVEMGEAFVFLIVTVETSDFGSGEEVA